jgi:hypothetical protein
MRGDWPRRKLAFWKDPNMNGKRLTGLLLVVGMAVCATGCSNTLVGTWENASKPEGQAFYLHNATFKDDGTYTASAKQGDENVRLAGTYEFDGFNLKLKTPGKPERKYGATYVMAGPTLELKNGSNKQSLKKK